MVFIGSGHNIDPRITPIRRPIAGGGSFSTAPITIHDQDFTVYTGSVLDGGFRFMTPGNMFQNGGIDLAEITLPLPVMWHEDSPLYAAPPTFAVRWTELIDSTVVAFVFDFPGQNVWRDINTTRPFDMVRPTAGSEQHFTLTIQIADAADLTTILAQANMKYEWDRT